MGVSRAEKGALAPSGGAPSAAGGVRAQSEGIGDGAFIERAPFCGLGPFFAERPTGGDLRSAAHPGGLHGRRAAASAKGLPGSFPHCAFRGRVGRGRLSLFSFGGDLSLSAMAPVAVGLGGFFRPPHGSIATMLRAKGETRDPSNVSAAFSRPGTAGRQGSGRFCGFVGGLGRRGGTGKPRHRQRMAGLPMAP